MQILLYNSIGFSDGERFVTQIKKAPGPVALRINSPGGSVFSGWTIFNAVAGHAPGVTATIDGIAASMASLIAIAARNTRIVENAMVMIHNPSTYTGGTADELRREVETLDRIKENALNAYEAQVKRAGKKTSRAELSKMMDAETWLTAKEALEKGLVDEIVKPERSASALLMARMHAGAGKNTPALLMEELTTEQILEVKATLHPAEQNRYRKHALGRNWQPKKDAPPYVPVLVIWDQFKAIEDAGKRTAFYRENKEALAIADTILRTEAAEL